MCVMQVFSAESSSPRVFMNCSTDGLTWFSNRSLGRAETMKSSAYRTKLTPLAGLLLFFRQNLSRNSCSSPSSTRFISAGEIIPPCGVPSSVGWKARFSMYPAFSHLHKIAFSIGMFANNHSWLILSKQARISPSNIQLGDTFRLDRIMKHCWMASAVDRSLRNPYEFGAAVVSATGSSASKYKASIARSFIVGIPNGRSFFGLLFLGMYVRRRGWG